MGKSRPRRNCSRLTAYWPAASMRTWKWAWGCCCVQLLQAFLEGLIAGAVLHHGERFGGRLMVGPEEGDTVTVACGINTDADAVEGRGGGHR